MMPWKNVEMITHLKGTTFLLHNLLELERKVALDELTQKNVKKEQGELDMTELNFREP